MNKTDEYHKKTKNSKHFKILEEALCFVDERNLALDAGCGTFRNINFLLEQGFNVVAFDQNDGGVKEDLKNVRNGKVTFTKSTFETFDYGKNKYNFIVSTFALPFTDPNKFENVLDKIKDSLKNGGVFCGQLFGQNDEWRWDKKMTFHNKAEIQELFSDYEVLQLEENEHDGQTALGVDKHWHIFSFIVKRKY